MTWWAEPPVWVAGSLVLTSATAGVRQLRRPRAGQDRVQTLTDDRWARDITRGLPAAWEAAGLHATSSNKPGTRTYAALPKFAGAGNPIPDGMEWDLNAGGWDVVELAKHEAVIASELNKRASCKLVSIRPVHGEPGWGKFRALRMHPLAKPRMWPYQPGQTPSDGRKALLGVDVTGKPVWAPVQEFHALIGGQNGGGKSVGTQTYLVNLMGSPLVELTVYDASVKRGRDYHVIAPRLRGGQVITDPRQIIADIETQLETMRHRSALLGGAPYQPTRELPLRVLVLEEAPALLAAAEADDDILLRWAQQTRAFGGVMVLISQTTHSEQMPTVLRAEFRWRCCYRVASHIEADMILGSGVRQDSYRPIPSSWPGVADVDSDETGVQRFRTYQPQASVEMTNAWCAAEGVDLNWSNPGAVAWARCQAFLAEHARLTAKLAPHGIDEAPVAEAPPPAKPKRRKPVARR